MSQNRLYQAEAFWRYSTDTYSQLGMKDLCLACQDQLGLNVNVILLCGWVSVFGKTLTRRQVQGLLWSIKETEAKLKKQRLARNRYKRGSDAYRDCLKQELALEGEQQKILLQELAKYYLVEGGFDSAKASSAVSHPLNMYFSFSGINNPLMEQDLLTVFADSKTVLKDVERD